MQKTMKILNMLVIVIVVPVLILIMCLPVHEARRFPDAQNENKLFVAFDQGKAPPYVPNPTETGDIIPSMMNQKPFVTDHNIVVSPLLRQLLGKGPLPPSGPNPPSWIPAPRKSRTSSFMPKGSTP